ncbi:AMP-binding protein [Ruixingdingia sedimenti]|uniref:AMP-binding protein n=1 Tax=Ruixingdingia sedimenti TaxID=3073604 RepID=A0ABU1F2K7_9RHOB|nr:AMP-binding protein [Xinfangfangia sp. LG-4]MDR5651100.1 AMP-binding protein [Xinfangfangia sp. LG-4]
MLDLGRSFLASVSRDPKALALTDGATRLDYQSWFRQISAVTAALGAMGLKRGDRLASVMQNTAEAATLHWACQFAGIMLVPLNWRATAEELDFVLENAEAAALAHDGAAAEAVAASPRACALPRLAARAAPQPGVIGFAEAAGASAPDALPMASPEDWSLMLYTSGTTSKPKGVPRRHSAERAAALAHVAQNLMPRGEATLGVMPLYHTMGVRSLLSISLVNGAFHCLPRFDVATALRLIAAERISALYLVPTLYHDLLAHPDFPATDISSVRRLGFAGASMTDGLMARIEAAFRPDLFVNHYGSSEVYTFTIHPAAPSKPGSAGKAGLNQQIRVVRMGSGDPEAVVPAGTEGEIIATLSGDEAFEGYWRRPEADAKSLREGWYFTGDMGFFDTEGDLFVTGRVDDMMITGGENVAPVEVESCLSVHEGVAECAVVGLPDERWGQIVTAFVVPRGAVTAEALDAHCRASALAPFKRPRRYVLVAALPKSPVGKLLRRNLLAGDYTPLPGTTD